jgi:predicted DNA-binding transcriptional regulator AlpA
MKASSPSIPIGPDARPGQTSLEVAVRARLASYAVDVVGAALVLGISERQFYELRKREGFPKARRLSARVSRYLVSELVAWLAEQPVCAAVAEPEQLARGRVYRGGRLVASRRSADCTATVAADTKPVR